MKNSKFIFMPQAIHLTNTETLSSRMKFLIFILNFELIVRGKSPNNYQLAFVTPGISPFEAISRNWIRLMPNRRM